IDQGYLSLPPEKIAKKYLIEYIEPNLFLGGKTRMIYEYILNETGSTSIVHKYRTSTEIGFSKFQIKKVICLNESGSNPLVIRFLKNLGYCQKQYNYYDYMNAFEKIFLFQNSEFKHSWL
ncbi:hypothetical protein CFOL_v3_05491, partial [Cephalotus follicularis]